VSAAKTPGHEEVKGIVFRVLSDPKTKPADLVTVADLIERQGHGKTAAALRDRARQMAAGASPAPTASGSEAPAPPSPWKDVPSPAWTAFTRGLGKSISTDVDSRYRLGIFAMGARRLADLGLMRSPKKTTWKGRTGVWLADWIPPHSETRFLASPEAQYRTFLASMIDYRRAITSKPELASVIGKEIGDKKATLSGLLAVVHHAGLGGLGKWISGERRVPATTEAFNAATGIF